MMDLLLVAYDVDKFVLATPGPPKRLTRFVAGECWEPSTG